jgi:hypothetical protein
LRRRCACIAWLLAGQALPEFIILIGAIRALAITLESKWICQRLRRLGVAKGAEVWGHTALCARKLTWLTSVARSAIEAGWACLHASVFKEVKADQACLPIDAAARAVIERARTHVAVSDTVLIDQNLVAQK